MIADVVFDVPVTHPFSYVVPDGTSVVRGQRVRASLHGVSRVGIVVTVREGDPSRLRSIERPVESVPVLSGAALELGRWAAEESLSSLGSTLLSLLPPPPRRATEPLAPPAEPHPGDVPVPELWTGASRDERLANELGSDPGAALVVSPDRDGAARWAARLDAARLDSDAPDAGRRAAWFAAARGRRRIVVGTRSALLAPLPPPATLVLLDEHDAAHKPPGAPRMHSRDLLARRAALEGSRLVLLSATPSVETWWRADNRRIRRESSPAGAWAEIIAPETRGILRNHPLTLPLTRAIEDMSRAGRQVALIVTRASATLICSECGSVLRCPACGVALAYSRAQQRLACRLCTLTQSVPDRCPACGGHRLAPLGWDAERVEAAVRRRFPRLTVSRTDRRAQVVIAPPGLLRARPASLGAVGIVALDTVLSAADFRAGERAFALLWAAAEATGPDGRVIAQSLHREHYAVLAAQAHAHEQFYAPEIKFRAELGYPPFRRLCVVSVRGKTDADAQALIGDCAKALAGIPGLTVYPAAPRVAPPARSARWQFVVKGSQELPRVLADPLSPFRDRPRRRTGVIEIEMDPV